MSDKFDESMFDNIEFVQYTNEQRSQKSAIAALIGLVVAILVVTIGYLVLFIWQIFDSRKQALNYTTII